MSELALDSPLFVILVTLLVFRLALYLFARSAQHPLAHPLIVAPAIIALLMTLVGMDYPSYLESTDWLSWLLAPATVALAVPLYNVCKTNQRRLPTLVIASMFGGTISVLLALIAAWSLGAGDLMLNSLATKSITTPIALSVGEIIGGETRLIAAAVLVTGISGSLFAPWFLPRAGINDDRVIGFTLGVTAHGIGTARAFDISQRAGAFASLGMSLTGLITAVLLPLAFRYLS